ncbi:MAG: RPA family protein [Candidatus Methanomethylophilaceae archaeon]
MVRETAWRVFSSELNSSQLEIKGEEEKSPSYLITPLGAKVNRVLLAGVLMEKENIGSEEEPMWKARVQDPTGSFFINAGRYQPEASAALAHMEVPSFVAVVGKPKTFSPDDGRVFVSVRPERIVQVEEKVRDRWVLEACQSTWSRMKALRSVLAMEAPDEKGLVKDGMDPALASGIMEAIGYYGVSDSSRYLRMLQDGLRVLLPEQQIDLGLPGDDADLPDEIDIDPERAGSALDMEDTILSFLELLDRDGKGAPFTELQTEAEKEGIGSAQLEEITNSLMDKGLVYEPVLGKLKKI